MGETGLEFLHQSVYSCKYKLYIYLPTALRVPVPFVNSSVQEMYITYVPHMCIPFGLELCLDIHWGSIPENFADAKTHIIKFKG